MLTPCPARPLARTHLQRQYFRSNVMESILSLVMCHEDESRGLRLAFKLFEAAMGNDLNPHRRRKTFEALFDALDPYRCAVSRELRDAVKDAPLE